MHQDLTSLLLYNEATLADKFNEKWFWKPFRLTVFFKKHETSSSLKEFRCKNLVWSLGQTFEGTIFVCDVNDN